MNNNEKEQLLKEINSLRLVIANMLDALNSVLDENATLTIPTANKVLDAIKKAKEQDA